MDVCVFCGGDGMEQKAKQVKLQMSLIIMQHHYWTDSDRSVVCASSPESFASVKILCSNAK